MATAVDRVAGIYEVVTGWTGNITLLDSVTLRNVTVVPRQRESRLSMMVRVVERATQALGTGWSLLLDDAEADWVLSWPTGNNFSLVATLNTATLLGITNHSGATSYEVGIVGDEYPSLGLSLTGINYPLSQGRVAGDGAAAWQGAVRPTSATLTKYDTHAGAWSLAENFAEGVYDVWIPGRLRYTRLFLAASQRSDVGGVKAMLAETFDARGVS